MLQFFNLIASVATGFGIGSLISTWLIQHWEKKKLIYHEKLNIYSTFIQGYQEYVANPHDERLRQLCVAYQKHIELIAPKVVADLSRKFYETSVEEMHKTRDAMVDAMRKDLGAL